MLIIRCFFCPDKPPFPAQVVPRKRQPLGSTPPIPLQDDAESPHHPAMPPVIPLANSIDIAAALDQPYRTLARGGNVHAYVSDDGAYVLKTLATPDDIIEWFASDGLHLTDVPWARALVATDDVAAGATPSEAAIAAAIIARSLVSYQLAATRLPHQTALLHLQLPGETGRFPTVSTAGTNFDAATRPFILQYRADLVKRCLSGRPISPHAVIDAVVAFIADLWAGGIAEDTLNFHNNMGFVGGRLVQVDIGELQESRAAIRDHAASAKILHKKSFAWLQREHPPLADYMRDQVTQHLALDQIEARWARPAT